MKGMFGRSPSATPDMSSWNFSSITTMEKMFESVTLPTSTYSNLLVAIFTNPPATSSSLLLEGGSSKYYAPSQASIARYTLTISNGWTISDGGPE